MEFAGSLLKGASCSRLLTNFKMVAAIHTTSVRQHKTHRDRRDLLRNVPKKDEGVDGENSAIIEVNTQRAYSFPTPDTPNLDFNGTKFSELPIMNIKSSKNNTLFDCSDAKGKRIIHRFTGHEGFKNCRKGTNVAAQTTALSIASKLNKVGVKTVRVSIQGLGPGRMAAIEGLIMGGMEIVSITDSTPFSDNPPRPPVARSL